MLPRGRRRSGGVRTDRAHRVARAALVLVIMRVIGTRPVASLLLVCFRACSRACLMRFDVLRRPHARCSSAAFADGWNELFNVIR